MRDNVSVIIPIYNAFEIFCECIESVLMYSSQSDEIVLINDASTDKRIQSLIYKLKRSNTNIQAIMHENNKGYVKSINEGIMASSKDIILLNSDVIVTEGWIEKLQNAAYSKEKIMTVTPISNAAGEFSVPQRNCINQIPAGYSLETYAKEIEKRLFRYYVNVPTGNGYCMYIKRVAFDIIGLFDSKTFLEGYGEENDFCMRLIRGGYKNIISADTYIYHYKTASFGKKKNKYIQRNKKIIRKRYPDYRFRVGGMILSPRMIKMRRCIKNIV